LAELLRKQKALPQARSLAEEAFALYQLHPDWPADERRHAFEVLTEVLEDLDNLAGLEALLRAELARLQRQATNAPAGDSSEIAVVSHHLAAVLRERKALVEARSLAEEAATLYRRYPDWPPDERAHALLVLAAVLTDLGEFSELEAIHRERLEVLRVLLPADDPELAIGVAELAATLLEEKKFAEAEPLARECLALRQKHRPGDWRTFNARSMLGAALLGQNKHGEETEQMLLTGYEGMKQREDKIPAEARVRLGEALKRLVQLSEATGRLDQAAEWKKKLDEFDQPAR
jgi:tetratricopeptide (TPR) repeat protein